MDGKEWLLVGVVNYQQQGRRRRRRPIETKARRGRPTPHQQG
jgi:hypothetical protein